VFYRDDAEADTPWVTRPPFPVHLTSTVEAWDTVADTRTVSEYRYHHGHYDRAEREFRGFAPVDEIDAQHFGPAPGGVGDLDSPPVLTRRWYHTGVDPARGELVAAALAKRWQGDPLAPPPPSPDLVAGGHQSLAVRHRPGGSVVRSGHRGHRTPGC
jgi:Insecticide toxin TcdB middle/N-terminal region